MIFLLLFALTFSLSFYKVSWILNHINRMDNSWSIWSSMHEGVATHNWVKFLLTLRSQIEGYTLLLIFRKFSILPAVIWASPFINIQENFQYFCLFTYTNEKCSTLPAVIRAYPLIKFGQKFQSTLLLEPPLVLET